MTVNDTGFVRGALRIALLSALLAAIEGCGGASDTPANDPVAQPAPTGSTPDSSTVPSEFEGELVAFADPDLTSPNGMTRAMAALSAPLSGVNFLSDLSWTSARNDYGPVEIDQSVGGTAGNDGNKPLTMNGKSFQKGLGVHGESEVVYALNAQCTQFQATVGINDFKGTMALGSRGSVRFQVWADGVQLHETPVITGNSADLPLQLDVGGVRELKLVTKNNGNPTSALASSYDHADWADARVTCTGAAAPAWTFCANENNLCSFTGTRQVRFGANAQYVVRTLTAQNGGAQCTAAVFGGDPAPGVNKRCEVDGSDLPVVLPTIGVFSATPAAITAGSNAALSWTVNNADSLSIDQGIGTVTGTSRTVSPTQTTTYTLTARNVNGPVTRMATVTVSPVEPLPVAPTIASFAASPAAISVGSAATLTWSVSGANSLSISPSIGTVTGSSRSVSPTQTTTYTLSAVNANGTTTKEVTVTVNQPPPQTGWTRCANEFGYCYFDGVRDVRFRTVDGRNVVREFFQTAACKVETGGFSASPGSGEKYCEYGPIKLTTVDPPDHSGMGPFIDVTKIPRGSPGSSEVRTVQTDEQPGGSDGTGSFRTECFLSHMNYDDPLVYPGNPGAAHLHAFFGNTLTNANSTVESIANTGNSTCRGGIINRSSYWVPALIDTRDGSAQMPIEAEIYYKTGYSMIPTRDIQPHPKGLRMIAGNATATGAQQNVSWGCVDASTPANSTPGAVPNCPLGSKVQMVVVFPQCWNGKDLDSADHKSHMSYRTGSGGGTCPASHPNPMPEITFNIRYKVNEAGAPTRWRLSSDMYDANLPGGYSAHGDWFDGWQEDIKKTWTEKCDQAAVDCHSHLLGDGRAIY